MALMMQNSMNDPLGAPVGAQVGVKVGAPVGVEVGVPVGVKAGAPVDVKVGALIGARVDIQADATDVAYFDALYAATDDPWDMGGGGTNSVNGLCWLPSCQSSAMREPSSQAAATGCLPRCLPHVVMLSSQVT